ncbi:MAG: accessory Sec system protein Asp3 [Lachnospiraceae bacterium]|nr:accessory Sec system protein Asp3 [Lachnospiraceae bacterium]
MSDITYGEKWTVYWSDYMSDAYIYGSEVIFHSNDDVELKNNLMPAGSVIKSWYSKTNYQMQRIEPTLPIIDGEGEYELSVNMETDIDEGVLVRMIFFDRYQEEIGQMIFREETSIFKCPMATYSYCLQLIAGGSRYVRFHSAVIREVIHESESEYKEN